MTIVPKKGTIVPIMGTQIKNDSPSAALFGKTRRAILSLLYSHTGEAFYLRHILRVAGVGHGAAQRELKQLSDAGVLQRTVKGKQVYYQANPASPIFQDLKGLLAGVITTDVPERSDVTSSRAERNIRVPQEKLAEFCRRHYIRRLALFGSVLRPDFRPDSDIDVLVEFEAGHVPGFAIVAIEGELSRLVGRKVDLRTPGDLSRYFRDRVVREAEVQYAAP